MVTQLTHADSKWYTALKINNIKTPETLPPPHFLVFSNLQFNKYAEAFFSLTHTILSDVCVRDTFL